MNVHCAVGNIVNATKGVIFFALPRQEASISSVETSIKEIAHGLKIYRTSALKRMLSWSDSPNGLRATSRS